MEWEENRKFFRKIHYKVDSCVIKKYFWIQLIKGSLKIKMILITTLSPSRTDEYFKYITLPILTTALRTRFSYPHPVRRKLRCRGQWQNWDSNPGLSGPYSSHCSMLPSLYSISHKFGTAAMTLLPGRKLFKASNMKLGTEKDKTTMSGV